MTVHVFMRKLIPLSLWALVTTGPASADEPPRFDDHGNRPRALEAWRSPDAGRGAGVAKTTADWRQVAPAGGEIRALAFSPTDAGVALAALQAGVYRSVDGGASWSRVEAMDNVFTDDVEFAADGTAYAATLQGVWKSTDGGVAWTELDIGIPGFPIVLEVAADPNDANTVWIGLSDDLGSQPITVMRTTDAGATWTPATPPMGTPLSCAGIAIHPADSQEVVAVFQGFLGGGAVWISQDGGATWADRSAGLPNNPMNDVVHDGSRILVGGGQAFGSQFVGLYASSDGGLSWTPLHDGSWPTLIVNDVEIDPDDPNILLAATFAAGVHISTDGGASWQLGAGGSGLLSVFSARFAPADPDVILLGTSSLGVYRSVDGGAGFGETAGIELLDVNSLVADPNNPDRMAVAFQGENDGGVFTSTDGGASWVREPVPTTRFITVRFAPDGTLYAVSDGPANIAPEGVYRRDAGGTWTGLGPDQGPFFETELKALWLSANDPDLILAGGADFGVAGFEPTIWRSSDGGQSWDKAYEGFGLSSEVTDLEIVEDGTDAVAVASHLSFFGDPGGVLRSTDGGANWLDSNSGLPTDVAGSSLCSPPGAPATFYLADRSTGQFSGGVHRSTDSGQRWQKIGQTGAALDQIACDPTDADILYVAPVFSLERLRRSVDGGLSFTAFEDGLEDAGAIRRLDVAAGSPTPRLLMATHRGGYATYLPDEGGVCTLDPNVLCLPPGNRFHLSVTYESIQGGGVMGDARPLPLSPVGLDLGGVFYFNDPRNPELLVKVLDGCAVNGHYWVFYAATTNIGFELTVSDTIGDATRVYLNPDLTVAPATTDTLAFATCP